MKVRIPIVFIICFYFVALIVVNVTALGVSTFLDFVTVGIFRQTILIGIVVVTIAFFFGVVFPDNLILRKFAAGFCFVCTFCKCVHVVVFVVIVVLAVVFFVFTVVVVVVVVVVAVTFVFVVVIVVVVVVVIVVVVVVIVAVVVVVVVDIFSKRYK